MPRYGMVMDVTRCNGCYNCFLACKDEFCGNAYPPYSAAQPMTGQAWLRIIEKERGQYPKVKVDYLAVTCMHCDRPACAGAGPEGAVVKRDDGIVLVDPEKAAGCRDIAAACPYRVVEWNETEQVPQKCTLCAHLLDAGYAEPRCVEACPTGALLFGDLGDPESAVSKALAAGAEAAVLHSEYGLGEKVRYIGLPGEFVAGAVVFGDTDACGEGATVTLTGDDGRTATAVADTYGDFAFDGLPTNARYTVTVAAPGYEPRDLSVRTSTSLNLGDIVLDALQEGAV